MKYQKKSVLEIFINILYYCNMKFFKKLYNLVPPYEVYLPKRKIGMTPGVQDVLKGRIPPEDLVLTRRNRNTLALTAGMSPSSKERTKALETLVGPRTK